MRSLLVLTLVVASSEWINESLSLKAGDMRYLFDSSIIRQDDIGGMVGTTLSDADAFVLGLSFGTTVVRRGGSLVAVAQDLRDSSASLATALAEGLSRTGCDVLHVGTGSLPMLGFALRQTRADAAVMVGGGHGPSNWNGFKLMFDHGPLHGETIRSLAALAAVGDWEAGKGSVRVQHFEDAYVDRLLSGYRGGAFKVAWQCGSGVAGSAVRKLTRRLPGEHHLLPPACESHGSCKQLSFAQDNLAAVRQHVLAQGCDVGFALDGAGDRIIAIDGQGRALWHDQILAILARPGREGVRSADRAANGASGKARIEHGAISGVWKSCQNLIKPRMKHGHAAPAEELSGEKQVSQRWRAFDDCLFTALRLLEAIQISGGSLADIVNAMPAVHSSPELHFSVPPNRKFVVAAEIRHRLEAGGLPMEDAEAVRVARLHGQWLIRPSDSADLLIARAESATESGLESLVSEMSSAIGFSVAPIPVNLPRVTDPIGMLMN